MDWLTRMNQVLDYIEEHLDQEIDYKELAKIAYCSDFHFSRMFASLSGISLSEYIRRRRLTRAAFDLQRTDIRILEVANTYGYESADSFSRAFKKMHGIKPSECRHEGVPLKAFPKISFQLTIKGDTEMEYRIEHVEFEITLAGKGETVSTNRAFKIIPTLWSKGKKNGFMQELIDMSWKNPKCTLEGVLGVCGKEAAIMEEEFTYFMGVRYDGEPREGMETVVIPPSTWAVFPNVREAWKRLYTEWVPTSGYELANLPCIECYYGPGHKPRHELWVPIVTP